MKKPRIKNAIRRLLHIIGIHHWSEWHALHEDLNWNVEKRVCSICNVYETRPRQERGDVRTKIKCAVDSCNKDARKENKIYDSFFCDDHYAAIEDDLMRETAAQEELNQEYSTTEELYRQEWGA